MKDPIKQLLFNFFTLLKSFKHFNSFRGHICRGYSCLSEEANNQSNKFGHITIIYRGRDNKTFLGGSGDDSILFYGGVYEKCAINISLSRKTVCYRQSSQLIIYQFSLYIPSVSYGLPQGMR
jgi:hypothetical protein